MGHLHEEESHCIENGTHFCLEENHHHCDLCDTLVSLTFFTPYSTDSYTLYLQDELSNYVNGSLTETSTLRQRDRAPPVA